MRLLQRLNPSQSPRVEAAMYKMARGNSLITVVGLIFTLLFVGFQFHDSVDVTRLSIWITLMLSAAALGSLAHRALHPADFTGTPTVGQMKAWRRVQLFAFVVEGFAWGSLGLLFELDRSATQNALFLVFYLAAMSVGGHASASHSYRLYLLAVSCSLFVMLPNLANGFGEHAMTLFFLVLLYAAFIAKVAFSSQKTVLRSVELQIENEELLKEKTLASQLAERERIYRDLHDDVGAKLLGLAISAQRANLPFEADLARSALQDLRDVVSRSSQISTRFDHLLADWRAETERRVQAAGLDLGWHVPMTEDALPVNPSASLHLSRILREAISNVLRHACASHIHVSLEKNGDRWILQIQDDGVGLPETDFKIHRGMNGMQERASMLGGHVTWKSLSPRGCNVVVEFAIPRPAPDQAALT